MTEPRIHVVHGSATPEQREEMSAALGYIKLAVDVRRGVIAGGGIMHADCEAALLEDGSVQDDVWGADWIPLEEIVEFESLINIRPDRGNRSLRIEDPEIRQRVESVVRERLIGGKR